MKGAKWTLTLVLLASLVLGSLVACGGDTESDTPSEPEPTKVSEAEPTKEPESTNTPVPTDTPEPTTAPTDTAEPEPVGDLELDATTLSAPTDLTSYRSKMRIVIQGTTDGQETEESLEFTIEYTSEPPAQHIVVSGVGFEGTEELDSFEMYQVEDTMYLKMGEEWMSFPSEPDEALTEGLVTPGTLLEETCGWKKEGDTEIAGIKVHHWTISKEDMEACMPSEELTEMGDLTDAGGDLYVAVDGNYIVQMDLFFEGKNLDLGLETTEDTVDTGTGRMDIHFEMTDVNVPFTIELPEEALASGGTPDDIPIPTDAEEVNSMFSMITFLSPSTPQEVSDFYKAEMPNNGWTEVSVEELGGMFMLEYSKENRTASLLINTDDETDKTSVLITIEEEGQ
jgi:hypothetical protein